MKVHVVIPIGVSTPGTPVLEYLKKSVDCVQKQIYKDVRLTVASDENVPDETKKFLADNGVDVEWFSPASFFRRGGIWKKITETWKKHDSEYVAFLHYDDLWSREKLEMQIPMMERENLNSSWSEVYVIDGHGNAVSNDMSSWTSLDRENVGRRTVALAHSAVVRKKAFFESGIMKYEDIWSPVFEDLFALYLHVMKSGKKAHGSRVFWRNHDMNMTNSMFSDPKWKALMEEQRIIGEYSNSEIDEDVKGLHVAMRETANTLLR